MIRLRHTDGSTLELPEECRFVEVTDVDGQVAMVYYQDDAGVVHAISKDDPEARNYSRMFKVKWCGLTQLPEEIFQEPIS